MENKNINLIEVNINQLNPAKYNPRKNLKIGDEEYNKIKKSIEHFGYVEPVVINHDNTVISGHQRLKVLKDLGYKQITVVKLNLSSQEEKALNIALNKIKGEWDVDKLKTVIKELDSFDFDVTLTGYSDEELLNMDCDIARKYLNKSSGALRKKFIVPPFSILDTRQTEWQKRKKQWNKMINSQNDRGDKLMGNEFKGSYTDNSAIGNSTEFYRVKALLRYSGYCGADIIRSVPY